MRLEDIAPFTFPWGRDAAKRALEAAGVRCDHHLLLDRHKAAATQLRRDWPSKMIEGDGWFGIEEYRQALDDAPHVSGDRRRRRWGQGEARTHLGHLTTSGLIRHDADNDRWQERRHPGNPLTRPEVSERHNARNRARYQAKMGAERAHEQSLECLYGPFCAPTHIVSSLKTAGLSPCNAPESNSPEVYTTAAKPNHSAEVILRPTQPSASAADLDVRGQCLESLAAANRAEPSPSPEPMRAPELEQALRAQYRRLGNRLTAFDERDAEWVAEWVAQHRGQPDEHCVMAKRHQRWRLTRAKVPEACVKKTAKSVHVAGDVLTKADFFNTAPPPSRLEPLKAQPKPQLAAARAAALAHCLSAPQGRAPTRRLADIDELLAALDGPPAHLTDLRTFCEDHPWAGTLNLNSAIAVRASIELWAYIARRMETTLEPTPVKNMPAVLFYRVRQWQRAQAKGCASRD